MDLDVELKKSLHGMRMSIGESDCQMRILEYRVKDTISGETMLTGTFSIEDEAGVVDKESTRWYHRVIVKSFKEGGDND